MNTWEFAHRAKASGYRIETLRPDWVAVTSTEGCPDGWYVRVVAKAVTDTLLADAELRGPERTVAITKRLFHVSDELAADSFLAQCKGTSQRDRITKGAGA